MGERRLKHWGWGYADAPGGAGTADGPVAGTMDDAARAIREMLGFGGQPEEAVPFERIDVPPSRLQAPGSLAEVLTDDAYERLLRSMGKSYCDVVRGFRGEHPEPPDLVARPRDGEEVERVLDWAESVGASVVPFGGGTSVVGGVEAERARHDVGGTVVTLDMRRMANVLEVDDRSLAARIQAGASGPGLEAQLREHGLTLRFYPQSFEFSTLGGWIATRAGGHFATGPTHIEDFVESVRALTPRGEWASRRLPGSGAGISPDRMLAGSEGILGVITESWVRVRPRPTYKASASVELETFTAGAAAVRELTQAGLPLANCRLIDPLEAVTTGTGDGSAAVLLLGLESAHHPVHELLDTALEVTAAHAGRLVDRKISDGGLGRPSPVSGDQWRSAFLLAPYLRDTLVACGVLSETFETAITWDRFEDFHSSVSEAARQAAAEVSGVGSEGSGAPRITCRFTHAYPDGPALYYTVLAPAVRGGEVEQWDEIKAAVSEAILAGGGTVTHHHGIGRDHRPWYDRQRPEPFAAALRAAKATVDPSGLLNPGVLIDP